MHLQIVNLTTAMSSTLKIVLTTIMLARTYYGYAFHSPAQKFSTPSKFDGPPSRRISWSYASWYIAGRVQRRKGHVWSGNGRILIGTWQNGQRTLLRQSRANAASTIATARRQRHPTNSSKASPWPRRNSRCAYGVAMFVPVRPSLGGDGGGG